MLNITCDECGKKYQVDETKMKGNRAKAKCKVCGYVMVVKKPGTKTNGDLSRSATNYQPAVTADLPEMSTIQSESAPPSAGEGSRGLTQDKPAEPDKDIAAFLREQKIRFGLFGKMIIVMLIVSLLPFAVYYGITLREISDRARIETENLMAQTAEGLGNEVDGWISNNVSILRTAAKLPSLISMDRLKQEAILKAIQKQYPWMYLVFTLNVDGLNVARDDDRPLKDYSDRQYYKDILNGKKLSWQTLIGKTSKKPALVIAVPIKSEGNLIGVMAAAMTIDEISNNVATWRKGKTGFAYLVDEKGYVVSHPDKRFVTTRKNLNSHPLIAGFRKKGWQTITTQFMASNGETTLGHVRSNNYGWALVLQQQNQEVFKSFNRTQEFALILLAGTILVVLIIAWFSARSIVTPIMKLTYAAERMSLGELSVNIDIKSKDEIGLLAQAISRMQISLRLAMDRLRRRR